MLSRWLHRQGYEDRFGAALLAAIQPGDVVWDVGANVGFYSGQFLTAAGHGGKVAAFEPADECSELILQRYGMQPNFLVLKAALGESDGTIGMEMAGTSLGSTHRVVSGRESLGGNVCTVPVRSARSICKEYPEWFPNVVKIDVEGHEGSVVGGFGELLGDSRLRVFGVEIHFNLLQSSGAQAVPRSIERSLQAAGFKVRWTDPSHLVAIKPG